MLPHSAHIFTYPRIMSLQEIEISDMILSNTLLASSSTLPHFMYISMRIYFMWPFLSLFSPITSHSGQVFMGLHDPTNHCSKSTMPIVQIMRTIMLWNVLDRDHCAHFENTGFCPNSSRAPYQAEWPVSGTSHNMIILDSYPTLHNLFMNSCGLFQCCSIVSCSSFTIEP